jgi:hypothetical protein
MTDAGLATTGVAAAGLTILGVTTGLDASLLLAGLVGGLWAQTYAPPANPFARIFVTLLASVLAGYFTPAIAAGIAAAPFIGGTVAPALLKYPAAVLVGLLAQAAGPWIMRAARRKAGAEPAEDAAK